MTNCVIVVAYVKKIESWIVSTSVRKYYNQTYKSGKHTNSDNGLSNVYEKIRKNIQAKPIA